MEFYYVIDNSSTMTMPTAHKHTSNLSVDFAARLVSA